MTASMSRGARDRDWIQYLRRCADGDQAALAAFYDESSRYVYGMALRILRDPADAEEITLDVYSQIWRSASTFTAQRGSVLAWLVTLTRSRAIDRLRTQAARSRRTEGSIDEMTPLPDPGENPEESTVAGYERKRVREALEQLTPEQRQLIELSYFSGLSHSELASKLGQPIGTVKTRIRSGMLRLREILL